MTDIHVEGEAAPWAVRAMEHVRALVDEIGPRPSTSKAERAAAEYVYAVMDERGLDLDYVRQELFPGLPSTYRPLRLCLVMALVSLGVYPLLLPTSGVLAAALGAWAAYSAYSLLTLKDWPLYRLMGKRTSQNTIGIVPPRGVVRRTVVLLAHADSHRAALIYSSDRWVSVFSLIVGATFLALVVNPVAFLLGAATQSLVPCAVAVVGGLFQLFTLLLVIQADLAPYSPGANDDASGVGVALALAERLKREPLRHTAVWVAITGCEETWDGGVRAMIDAHRPVLADALWVEFDGVGVGADTVWLTGEGMLKFDRAHPEAMAAAEAAAARAPDLNARGEPGTLAYTQMGPVHKAGMRGVGINQRAGAEGMAHWHRLSDTTANIELPALEKAFRFGWALLQVWDEGAAAQDALADDQR